MWVPQVVSELGQQTRLNLEKKNDKINMVSYFKEKNIILIAEATRRLKISIMFFALFFFFLHGEKYENIFLNL